MKALFGNTATDDVSGAALDGQKVREARKLEMDFFEKTGVYTRAPKDKARTKTNRRNMSLLLGG